jgi:hypothetical protein
VSKIDSPFSVSKFIQQIFAHNKFAHCEQFSWAVSNFFADVSSKIITLGDPVLSQPDMERKWFLLRPALYSLIHDLPRIAGPPEDGEQVQYSVLHFPGIIKLHIAFAINTTKPD